MIPEHIINRKGPRSLKDLKPEVLEYLNQGLIETANLMEWLAVDQLELLKGILKDLNKLEWYDSFFEAVSAQKKPSANTTTKIIGLTFLQLTNDESIIQYLSSHTSDVPRCWAAYWKGVSQDTIENTLEAIKPYAADTHFGVREVAIFATKDTIINNLEAAVQILSGWSKDADENVRRYAVETIRPIGVWTKKIEALQEDPQQGLSVLEPLISDSSKYVRDSVGNWMNDASKSQPEWVQIVCKDWESKSSSKETKYILKKALRSVNK